MKRYLYIYPLLLIFFYNSCKEVETHSDTGLAYFPLSLGMINIYSIDTIRYNAISSNNDSVRIYLKEMITEEKTDSEGYAVYKAEAYYSLDTSEGWLFKDYYFYKKNDYHINLVKSGSIVSIFVFPVTKGRKWNLNAYNGLDPEYASYLYVAKPWNAYSDCVEVFVKEDINIIEESVFKQTYCRDKGLVHKVFSDISINNSKKNGYKVIINLLQ